MTKKKPKTIDPNDFAKAFFTGIVSNFALDKDKAYGRGVEFKFGKLGTLLIHYAGEGNKAYQAAMKRLVEDVGAENLVRMSKEDQRKRLAVVYADTIVVGLLMNDEAKTPVSYNAEAKKLCAEALSADGMEDVFSLLQEEAKSQALFRRSVDEANAKN